MAERTIFDARAIRNFCNGMLPVRTYERIYRNALAAPPGDIVEVGTAHGAATVCLALALKDSGRPGKVHTFEKIIGGSREAFGGIDENTRIIRRNLDRFGVADRVELIIGDVRDEAPEMTGRLNIGALFLDADGRLERDFGLFFDRLTVGGLVIIDDVRPAARLSFVGLKGTSGRFKVEQKHRISRLLLDVFQRHGLVGEGAFIGPDTWMGHKANGGYASVPVDEIIDAYRELVFADVEMSMIPGRKVARRALKKVLPAAFLDRIRNYREKEQSP